MELNNNDVVKVEKANTFVVGTTFTVEQAVSEITSKMDAAFSAKKFSEWMDGIPCELLQPGCQWQTGKIRLRLEFLPDGEG